MNQKNSFENYISKTTDNRNISDEYENLYSSFENENPFSLFPNKLKTLKNKKIISYNKENEDI